MEWGEWLGIWYIGTTLTFLFNLIWITFIEKSYPKTDDLLQTTIYSAFFPGFWIWLVAMTTRDTFKRCFKRR